MADLRCDAVHRVVQAQGLRNIVLTPNGAKFAPTIPVVLCQHCQAPYRPKRADRTTCCSRECGYARQRQQAEARRIARAAVAIARQCRNCGVEIGPRRRLCGSCLKPDKTYVPRPKLSLACVECGTVTVGTRARRKCDRCLKAAYRRMRKHRHRAREYGCAYEPVDPIKVFERDGWRCQLCGSATPQRLRGSLNDRAPELDHIVPLSAGGEHTYRNTQCACRRCNIAKGAKPLGQLRLIG